MTGVRTLTEAMEHGDLYKLTAFSDDPTGGNPAGVWVGTELPPPDVMLRKARAVGFSETAFLAPKGGDRYQVRYYSPEAEVSFCGHATIASGVVLGRTVGFGSYRFETAAGDVRVDVGLSEGQIQAALTSVEPVHRTPAAHLLEGALSALGWEVADLDPAITPAVGFAGAWHLILATRTKTRLDTLDYDFPQLTRLMLDNDLTTLQLVWREQEFVFHSRNPFPVGGVVEDPATGAAAAALGGYLRDAGIMQAPATISIWQGEKMGRPGHIVVDIPVAGGIGVRGTAVDLPS